MSEENTEEYNVSGNAEVKDRRTTVKVNVDSDAIAAKVREQMLREQTVDKDLQHFETLKEMAIEQYKDWEDQINACSSPAEVMEILEQARSEKKPTEKRAPYGKSTFLPPSDSSKFGDVAELIDSLYETAFYNLKATSEEKADARKKINELWRSFETGKTHSQLMESPSNVEKIMKPLSECPSCHRTIPPLSRNNPVCVYCGYDVTEKHEGRRGTSIRAHEWVSSGEPPK